MNIVRPTPRDWQLDSDKKIKSRGSRSSESQAVRCDAKTFFCGNFTLIQQSSCELSARLSNGVFTGRTQSEQHKDCSCACSSFSSEVSVGQTIAHF